MNTADILEALPNLSAAERAQIFQRLCQLLDEDLVREFGPTPDEMRILDAALADYARDGNAGVPWRACLDKLNGEQRKTHIKQLTDGK